MKQKILTGIILIINVLCFHLKGFAQNWTPVSSEITFKIKHSWGSPAIGTFGGFVGNFYFDPTNLSKSLINASIDAKSIDTGIKLRDNVIRSDEYFDAEKFPRIAMTSTKIEKSIKPNEFVGSFSLTIKNITKNIKIPFIFEQIGNKSVFKSNFTINRIDYKIGHKSLLIDNTATVTITVNTQQ